MKRLLICLLALLWLPTSAAHARDAKVYFDLASKSSTAKKKIEYLSKALDLDPNLASAYAKRGMLYYFQGKYKEVVEDFENFTRLQPDNAEGYRMLGMGYLYMGTYDAAIATFSHALKIDPNLISALCYRAEAYRRSGQNEEAIGDSTEAIHLAREPRILADAYITRAKVYRELGLQDKAFADVRAALLKDPRTYFYRYVSSYASLEEMRGAGLIGIIVLAFVLVFKLRFKAPKKDE
jgi:tetratricopeptide (TPR) repeat protein